MLDHAIPLLAIWAHVRPVKHVCCPAVGSKIEQVLTRVVCNDMQCYRHRAGTRSQDDDLVIGDG